MHERTAREPGGSSRREPRLRDRLRHLDSEPSGDTLAAADCVLILTNHSQFDYRAIAERASLVVDTRNAMKQFRGARSSIVSL